MSTPVTMKQWNAVQKLLSQWRRTERRDVAPEVTAANRKLLQRLDFMNPNYHFPPPPPSPPPSPPSPPSASSGGAVPWQGTLQGITSALGKADRPVHRILYIAEKGPQAPNPSPPDPTGSSGGAMVPWQGTLQGITTALGRAPSSTSCH